MKYVANPVVVDAFRIEKVSVPPRPTIEELEGILNRGEQPVNGLLLELSDGSHVVATPEMISRMTPVEGDYWVVQSDGYFYLNPKDVFERKYTPKPEERVRAMETS